VPEAGDLGLSSWAARDRQVVAVAVALAGRAGQATAAAAAPRLFVAPPGEAPKG
jgi:hypothetical protein